MKSAQQIRKDAERRKRRMKGLGVLAVILVVVIGVSLLFSGSDDGPAAPNSSGAPVSATPSVPPGSTVRLPVASSLARGRYPVGFEHTALGAVSAQVTMLTQSWVLDPGTARDAARVYALPEVREKAAAGGVATAGTFRRKIGVAVAGTIPAEAYLTLVPVAVTWKELPDQGRVQVAVMLRMSGAASLDAAPIAEVITIGGDWLWDPRTRGGDWVFTAIDTRAMVPDVSAVGSAQFVSDGWKVIDPLGPR